MADRSQQNVTKDYFFLRDTTHPMLIFPLATVFNFIFDVIVV